MQLKTCWLCDNELTMSREHIIPQSMGGKRTVRGFICRDCNSRTGHSWDAAVSEFEAWKFHLDSSLRINPQQGKRFPVSIADTGQNAFLDPGVQVRLGYNAPVITHDDAGQVTYRFTGDASQMDDLFNTVNRLLQRRGKDPMTLDEFEAHVEYGVTQEPVITFSLRMDMPKYYRSLVKTSMAMAFSVGVNPLNCENAVRYLRDETAEEEGMVTLPGASLEGMIDEWTNYHAVTIFGSPKTRQLMGEVLYFGIVSGLVILSDSYRGPRIIASHAINLKTGEYEDAALNIPDLLLPEHTGMEMFRARIEPFKSPMLLQTLGYLNLAF